MIESVECIYFPGIILGMGSANERQRYNVMASLIGYAHTQKDPTMSPILMSFSCDREIFSTL